MGKRSCVFTFEPFKRTSINHGRWSECMDSVAYIVIHISRSQAGFSRHALTHVRLVCYDIYTYTIASHGHRNEREFS